MVIDRMVFGMHHLTITQAGKGMTGGNNLSHIAYELDLAGEDAGIDFWRNMMPNTYWKVAGKWGTSGTVFFWSCDKSGNSKKVLCADGMQRYLTLAMTHSFENYKVGRIIGYKDVMYQEGRNGWATGNHIHLECASGKINSKILKGGVYILEDMLDPRKVFFILDGYTTVKSTLGLTFKHCSKVAAEIEEPKKENDMKVWFNAKFAPCVVRDAKGNAIGTIAKGGRIQLTGFDPVPWVSDKMQHGVVNWNGKIGFVQLDLSKTGYVLTSE